MKMIEANGIISIAAGYRVSFERRERGLLVSDHFPERDEVSIKSLDDAWNLAEQFAAVDPARYVNVYVIHALDWTPVDGYAERKLNQYPPYPTGDRHGRD